MSENKNIAISKKLLIVISLVSILVVVGVVYFVFRDNEASSSKMKVESNVIVSKEDTSKSSFEEMQKRADQSKIGVKMNINPAFKDGKSKGNIKLENTSSNGNSFTVSIVIEKTGQIVYESGLIEKGTKIDEIELNENLDKGEYPAVAYFTAYDTYGNKKGTSGINLSINILN